MSAQRFWPAVQILGRGFINVRADTPFFHHQNVTKAYNVRNFNNGHSNVPNQIFYPPSHDWRHTPNVQDFTSAATPQNNVHSNRVCDSSLQEACISVFKDSENEHAHDVLRSLPAYNLTTTTRGLMQPSKCFAPIMNEDFIFQKTDWSKVPPFDLAQAFLNLSEQCYFKHMDLENSNYSLFCQTLANRMPLLNDDLLLHLLKSLSLWPPTANTTTPNFMLIWNTLDKVLTERISKWNTEMLFLVADHWYALRLSRITKFNPEMVKVLGKKVKQMTPSQIVQYLFYANLSRQLSPFIVLKDLEKQLISSLNHLTIEELGVIAMGFFKTQTFPKNIALLEAILKKTSENLHCISDPALGAILKLLRRTIPVSHWSEMMKLMDSLVPHVNHLNHMCLLQIALLGNDLLVFHPEIISKITCRFAQNINEIRLKDLERITFVLMLYNFIPPDQPDILEIITDELRKQERKEEISQYSRCFVSCVVYLVTMGHMPHDLISAALHPSMLKQLQSKLTYTISFALYFF